MQLLITIQRYKCYKCLKVLLKRKGMFLKIFTLGLCLILNFSSFARTGDLFEKDYFILKKIPADYRSFGAICEQVARLRLKEMFDPKKFQFIIGLEYRNSRRVLGEIDLIVVSKKNKKVIVVGEVKCWKNLKAASKKAKKQLNRFFTAIKSMEKILFFPKETVNLKFKKEDFFDAKRMLFSQKVEGDNPFENNIGLTLNQVKKLRQKLQVCQKNRECPSLK